MSFISFPCNILHAESEKICKVFLQGSSTTMQKLSEADPEEAFSVAFGGRAVTQGHS